MNETVEAESTVSFDALCERGKGPRREGELEDEDEGFGGKLTDFHLFDVKRDLSEGLDRGRERKAYIWDCEELKPDFGVLERLKRSSEV